MSAQQRNKIAALSEAELEALTVGELKVLCKGVCHGYSRFKKAELMAALIEATTAERQLAALGVQSQDLEATATAEALRENVSQDLGDFVQRIAKQLNDAAVNHWDGKELAPEIFSVVPGIGNQITTYLDQLPGHDGKATVAHRLRERSRIMGALKDTVEAMEGSIYKNAVLSCLQLLEKHVSVSLAEATREKKVTGSANVKTRSEAKGRKIDVTPLYQWAEEILTNVDNLSSRQWREVAIALILATGRRPCVEVMCSNMQLEKTGDYAASFTGQGKAKGLAAKFYAVHPSYEIPLLFPADIVIKAYNWLQATGKQKDDPAKAHRLHSGNLSKKMAELRAKWGMPKRETLTCKGMRAIYAKVATANHRAQAADPQEETAYIAHILGHGRYDLRLMDSGTPQAYKADFELTQGWDLVPTGAMPTPPTTEEKTELYYSAMSK